MAEASLRVSLNTCLCQSVQLSLTVYETYFRRNRSEEQPGDLRPSPPSEIMSPGFHPLLGCKVVVIAACYLLHSC